MPARKEVGGDCCLDVQYKSVGVWVLFRFKVIKRNFEGDIFKGLEFIGPYLSL